MNLSFKNKKFKVCKSFGFESPPFVDLPVSNKPKPKNDGGPKRAFKVDGGDRKFRRMEFRGIKKKKFINQ